MKRAAAIILIAFLLLAGLTYAIAYGYDQISRSCTSNSSNRRAKIVELYSKNRDGYYLFAIENAWTNSSERRLSQCKTEISIWLARILERVNEL